MFGKGDDQQHDEMFWNLWNVFERSDRPSFIRLFLNLIKPVKLSLFHLQLLTIFEIWTCIQSLLDVKVMNFPEKRMALENGLQFCCELLLWEEEESDDDLELILNRWSSTSLRLMISAWYLSANWTYFVHYNSCFANCLCTTSTNSEALWRRLRLWVSAKMTLLISLRYLLGLS